MEVALREKAKLEVKPSDQALIGILIVDYTENILLYLD